MRPNPVKPYYTQPFKAKHIYQYLFYLDIQTIDCLLDSISLTIQYIPQHPQRKRSFFQRRYRCHCFQLSHLIPLNTLYKQQIFMIISQYFYRSTKHLKSLIAFMLPNLVCMLLCDLSLISISKFLFSASRTHVDQCSFIFLILNLVLDIVYKKRLFYF